MGRLAAFGGLFAVMAGAGSLCFFQFAPPERTCLSCHEIQKPYDRWAESAHREVSCKQCHGGTLTSGVHGLRENFKRLLAHFRETSHDAMRLSDEQVAAINEECGRCHAQEFAHWQGGGHGIGYAAIFLDEKHNRTEQVAEDCLRCHGMFFEGSVAEVVEPLDTKGPWRLKDARLADHPAVPCLACHQIHVAGQTSAAANGRQAEGTPAAGERRGTVALYSRRERAYFAAADLPVPKIHDHGRPVAVASDPRQRVCVQCHAPDSFGQAGSSDDRTPVGVHEGLSCAACHAAHSNDARGSCANCHPRLSNCGLDVTTMDTTLRSPKSRHNIHFVRCADCHATGVPARKTKKPAQERRASSSTVFF